MSLPMKMLSCLGIPESTMIKLSQKSFLSSALKPMHLWNISGDNIYNLLSNHQLHIHYPLINSDHIDNTVNPSLSNKHTNTSSSLITALPKELESSTNSTKHPRTFTLPPRLLSTTEINLSSV